MTRYRQDPPPEDLRNMIYYEDGELYWREEYRTNSRRTDKPIGSVRNHGYKATRLRLDGVYRDYSIHRLIWWLINDDWPEVLDHINRNRLDNRIENLRVSTNSKNSQNMSIGKNNTSGYLGVTFQNNSWCCNLFLPKTNKHLFVSGYKDVKTAALARDFLALLFYGDHATQNLLESAQTLLDRHT